MMPKASADTSKIYESKRIVRQKNGWHYVLKIQSKYDPKIKNTRPFKSTLIGKIPPEFGKDVTKMVPTQPKAKKQPASVPAAVHQALEQVPDTRQAAKVIYPLDIVLLVILLSALSGRTSSHQIAEVWKNHRPTFEKWFPDFPESDISHDTVTRIMAILGIEQGQSLLERLTRLMRYAFAMPIVALDGQAVCAACVDGKRAPYIMSAIDTTSGLMLKHCLVGSKTNEITHAQEVLDGLDITGAVVTADAMNTQTDFVEYLIGRKADYCLALKGTKKGRLKQEVQWLFSRNSKGLKCAKPVVEKGHGRIESRTVRIIPGNRLPEDVLEHWVGLDQGTLIEIKSEVEKTTDGTVSTETRYYISSLSYESPRILETAGFVVRQHWAIENQGHWTLDVLFRQDQTQCKNAAYLLGRVAMNKLSANILTKYQQLVLEKEGKEISKPTLMTRCSDPLKAAEILTAVLGDGTPAKG